MNPCPPGTWSTAKTWFEVIKYEMAFAAVCNMVIYHYPPHADDVVGRPAEDEDADHHHRHLEGARPGAVQHARPRPPQLARPVGRRRPVRRHVAVFGLAWKVDRHGFSLQVPY